MIPLLSLLLLAVDPASSVFRLQPGAFIKLPDANQRLNFDNGAATKVSYDPVEKLLYVIGYRADVLHVVDMNDPANPSLIRTLKFSRVQEGLPDSIKVVGYDPKDMAWMSNCAQLMVVSEGDPHELNGVFEDPEGTIELLTPSIGDTVDKTELSVSEQALADAGLRQVFRTCDSTAGENPMPPASSRKQDLEPKAVHIDKRQMAYIIFQANNGIAKFDLQDYVNRRLYFYDLGTKDWSNYELDASFDDGAIGLESRPGLRSLYQPNTLTSFELNGKMWIATADQGSFRRYTMATCRFDESIEARSWRGGNDLSNALPSTVRDKLDSDMASVQQIGRLRVSRLHSPNDGWDNIIGAYDYVTAYGGRGFSILDPDNMNRVYDSGDDFERYFLNSSDQAEQVMFNVKVGNAGTTQASQTERASPETGQTPSAITAIEWNNSTTVLIVANGIYGGLFVYEVSSGPSVSFQSYSRRGNPGMTWSQAYTNGEDVGEPEISDLLYINDEGQRTLVVVSRKAAALSFYTLVNN